MRASTNAVVGLLVPEFQVRTNTKKVAASAPIAGACKTSRSSVRHHSDLNRLERHLSDASQAFFTLIGASSSLRQQSRRSTVWSTNSTWTDFSKACLTRRLNTWPLFAKPSPSTNSSTSGRLRRAMTHQSSSSIRSSCRRRIEDELRCFRKRPRISCLILLTISGELHRPTHQARGFQATIDKLSVVSLPNWILYS
jgi:hypothetical protein